MSEQLLPCPFCGSTNLDMRDARDFITCRDCGAEGPYQPGVAAHAWNSRADLVVDAGKKVAALELALKAKTEQLSALHKQQDAAREAIASRESERALASGGNGSRGTVPVHCERTSVSVVPLYAAPPKREPLTNEQIEALNFVSADRLDYDTYKIDKASVLDFARSIEIAHGIGGQS